MNIAKLPIIVTRYIPVGIVAVISTFFLIKFAIKKGYGFDQYTFWKKIMLVPIIIAIIILVYGIINVMINSNEINNKYYYLKHNEFYASMLEKVKGEAIKTWFITSAIYLFGSELVTLIMKNRKIY